MRAVTATADGFAEVELDVPAPGPHDLLVEVRAVSVNPVDLKVRGEDPTVLGFDAAGVVAAVGSEVGAYAEGDEVWYAGSVGRPGSNAAYQLVDEHVAGRKPRSLDFAEAAAMPLTAITAWESLFEKFRLTAASSGTLLVMAGAGGVGSMVVQLARQLTGVTVIATASRPESADWVRGLGAHHVVDHRGDLPEQLRELAPDGVNWVFSPFSAGNVETYAQVMAVHGEVVAIDEPPGLDLLPLKAKSQTWHWELMFAKPLHLPYDASQRELLDEVARLVDAGTLRTTMTARLTPITPRTLREAHERVAGSGMIGKVVIAAG